MTYVTMVIACYIVPAESAGMTKKIVQVPADESFVEKLDEIREGRSRAEVMRRAFLFYFDFVKEKELDNIYLRGYQEVPEESVFPEAQEKMIGEIFSEESW
jgi:Ribbon-helix-helix protein, copG family